MKDDPNHPQKGEVVYLEDRPDNVVIAPDAFKVTDVDIPVRLPNGVVCGKARVVEGDDDEASVLIELESSHPAVASMLKTRILSVSLNEDFINNPDSYGRSIDQ
jgi:hypothetical protein